MARYRRAVLLDGDISLRVGTEWHSKGISLEMGDIVTIEAVAPSNFYAEFAPREKYYRRVGSAGGAYPFEVGTARRGWTTKVVVEETDNWYMVFRVSLWDKNTTIHARIERLRPMD